MFKKTKAIAELLAKMEPSCADVDPVKSDWHELEGDFRAFGEGRAAVKLVLIRTYRF